ncbi:MAG: DMT family transporter [Planctomycetia bacterium]|nr:DMT family transporter [Planctomycetia bacterium]
MTETLRNSNSPKRVWFYMLFPLLASVFYVLSYTCMRQLAETQVNPWVIVGIREFLTAVCGVFLFFTLFLQGKTPFPRRAQLITFFLTSLALQFGGNIFMQRSFETVGMGLTTASCWAGNLLCTPIIGWFLLREKLTFRLIFSLSLVFVAVFFLTSGAEVQEIVRVPENSANSAGFQWLAVQFVLLSVLSGGLMAGSNCVVRWINNAGVSPFFAVMFLPGVGGVGLLGMEFLCNGFQSFYALSMTEYFFAVLAAVTNLLAFIFLTLGLRYLSAVRVSIVLISQLALSPLMGILLFHEPMNGMLVVGILFVAVALLVTASET